MNITQHHQTCQDQPSPILIPNLEHPNECSSCDDHGGVHAEMAGGVPLCRLGFVQWQSASLMLPTLCTFVYVRYQ